MTRIATNNFRGLIPVLRPVRATEPYVINGQNFLVTTEGVRSAFGTRCTLAQPYALNPDNLKGVQTVRSLSTGRPYICTRDGIYSYYERQNWLHPHWTFTSLSDDVPIHPWTYAQVGQKEYFATLGNNIIWHSVTDDLWGELDNTDDTVGICESGGRLFVATKSLVKWSSVANGDDFDFSQGETTGSGFQVLYATGQICFAYGSGVLTFTSAGIFRSELTLALNPFRHLPFHGPEFVPLNPWCAVQFQDNTIVFLTEHGFYRTDGIEAPALWQPLMSEFFADYQEFIEPSPFLTNVRLYVQHKERLLFVSVLPPDSQTPWLFHTAYVLHLRTEQWGSLERLHYGIIEYSFIEGEYIGNHSGYVDREGNLQIFVPQAQISDYSKYTIDDENPRDLLDFRETVPGGNRQTADGLVCDVTAQIFSEPELTKGIEHADLFTVTHESIDLFTPQLEEINCYVDLGPFRLVDEENAERTTVISALIINAQSGFGVFLRNKDYNLPEHEDIFRDYALPENRQLFIDFGSDSGIAIYDIELLTSYDGSSPEDPAYKLEEVLEPFLGTSRRFSCYSSGLYHVIRFRSSVPGSLFAVQTIESNLLPGGIL